MYAGLRLASWLPRRFPLNMAGSFTECPFGIPPGSAA